MGWQTGEQVGQYQIIERLGMGGMATVFKAFHPRLNRDVALKVLHTAYQQDADFLSRFEREAQIVASLEHPHIVPVYDYNDLDGQPYLVLKFVDGETLDQRLRQAALTLDEILNLLDHLSSALDYAHSQGVLHRDIKPSNVMIAADGTPYLTDFGLARLAQAGESSLSAGLIVGTPNYVSPEQASGEGDVSERSDVYSLGVMLYQMVVGRLPFSGPSAYATIHKHISEPPPRPSEVNPEVPPQVEAVLLRALEKSPEDRYPTPTALTKAFREAVDASGLKQLSPERSTILPDPTPQKPKRGGEAPLESSGLLLLDGEESWAEFSEDEILRRRIEKRREERNGFVGHAVAYVGVNLMLWFIYFSSSDPGFPWPIPTTLGWGTGLASHFINVYFQSARQVERLYQTFAQMMQDRFGPGWQGTVRESERQEVWWTAKKQKERFQGFLTNATAFVLISTMLWGIWYGASLDGDGLGFPWPLFPVVGWGLGVVGHGLTLRGTGARHQRSMAAEIEQERQRAYASSGKRKREMLEDDSPEQVRLTDDGELTESMVEEVRTGNQNRQSS